MTIRIRVLIFYKQVKKKIRQHIRQHNSHKPHYMAKLCTPINIDENSKVNFMLANSPDKKRISNHNTMTEYKSINIQP